MRGSRGATYRRVYWRLTIRQLLAPVDVRERALKKVNHVQYQGNQRIDPTSKLDKLDARADAFQAALEGSANQIEERIARNKQEARRALDKLTADIDTAEGNVGHT